jgi:hypothetical protein
VTLYLLVTLRSHTADPAPSGGSFTPAATAVGARYSPPDANVSVATAHLPKLTTPCWPPPPPTPSPPLLLLRAVMSFSSGKLSQAFTGKLDTSCPVPCTCACACAVSAAWLTSASTAAKGQRSAAPACRVMSTLRLDDVIARGQSAKTLCGRMTNPLGPCCCRVTCTCDSSRGVSAEFSSCTQPDTTVRVPRCVRVTFVEIVMLLLWPILMLRPLGCAAIDADQLYCSARTADTCCSVTDSWAADTAVDTVAWRDGIRTC